MATLHIGIASYAEMKARTIAEGGTVALENSYERQTTQNHPRCHGEGSQAEYELYENSARIPC
jgi:hypothetical protein